MKKQLITQQLINEIKNYKEYSSKRYFICFFGGLVISFIVKVLLVNIFHFALNNITVLISIFAGILLAVPFLFFYKEEDTSYSDMNYYIAEDVLLSKFIGDIKKPVAVRVFKIIRFSRYATSHYSRYILRFLNNGDFILPSKEYNKNYFEDCTIYDFAQREDRFYVLVDSNNTIREIFDTRLFEISLDDFELIENKYSPKK